MTDSSSPPARTAGTPDRRRREQLREAMNRVRIEVGKAVVGQDGTVTGLLIALLARGHVLLEGVPGRRQDAARALVQRGARARHQAHPVHARPDAGRRLGVARVRRPRPASSEFREGPVFTNIVLADEINRTPPKTQAALLEAMEERQVSTDGVTRPLPDPFLVAATQNPIEHEGTYTLPEAQLDRFLLKLVVDLPAREAELTVLRRHASGFDPRDLAAAGLRPAASADEIRAAQRAAASVTVSDDVLGYVVDLAQATRRSPSVQLGVSPRAATALLAASKAWAWLGGYPAITPDHVQTMLDPDVAAPAAPATGCRARRRLGRRRPRLGAAADARSDLRRQRIA